jgi:dienelactone hydrolase
MRKLSLQAILCLVAVTASATDLSVYAGNYRLGNRVLAIAEWEVDPAAPHVLAFTDLRSGRFGVLTEEGLDRFALHEGAMAGAVSASIQFTRKGGQVAGLTYGAREASPQRAERLPHRHLEVSVSAGGSSLGGTLLLPSGAGPFPAVVIVPAGRAGRMAAATFPDFFLSEGFAVLTYDRRAERAGFETYAGDALAAVEMLRSRRDIDSRRIGLWGHSQGGWLSIIAASKSAHVAFAIDHSGMFVPAWQQELYRLAAEGAADGHSPVDVAAAVSYEARLMRVAQSGTGWDELMATFGAGDEGWRELVYRPSSLEELQQIWRDDFSFDPRPYAKTLEQPVLALFGGLDRSTPIESAANLKRAVPPSCKLTVLFFPAADHAFLDATTGGNAEIPNLSRFVPGMFDSMRQWLRSVVVATSS